MPSTETLAGVVRARYFAENGSAGYPLAPADVAYLERAFVTLDAICVGRSQTPDELRQAMLDGRLPRPTYLLDDGTELVPVAYLALADAAGGVDALPAAFTARWRAVAGPDDQHGAEEWEAYLSGHYAACLRVVEPETIHRKGQLVDLIERLDAAADRDDAWRAALRAAVDELDALERPFAAYDRVRFGPVTRDTHIDAVRARHALS
jgi:Family of unknown function (DUF6058)